MRNAVIAALPGDELTLFAPAVLSAPDVTWDAILVCADPRGGETVHEVEERWRAACRELAITPRASLRVPYLERCEYDVALVIARLAPFLADYNDVYAPSFNDDDVLRQTATRAVASLRDELLVETASAGAASLRTLPDGALLRLFDVANRHYGMRMRCGRITAHDFRAARQYVRTSGAAVRHYADVHMEYYNAALDDDNPYDFETSEYERLRFELELDVLRSLEWQSLTEVGACVGTFTERLVDAFPGRRILAYEPAARSFARLEARVGGRAELRRQSADAIRERCDLLFLASVVYYMRPIPLSLFEVPARWIVASHGKVDHQTLLDPILHSAGWRLAATRELLPRIELYSGVPLLKGGSEVAVWERT